MATLPHIRNISIPSSLLASGDLAILRNPLSSTFSDGSNSDTSSEEFVDSDINARRKALTQVTSAEHAAIEKMGELAQGLQSVSFIRHAFPHDRSEYGVKYDVEIGSRRTIGRVSRSGQAEVVQVGIVDARAGQTAAWPYAPSLSLSFTLRKLWGASPEARRELALLYARDHQALALVVAGASGCVLGEAGHGLFKYTENAFVTTMVAGSCLYACTRLVRN